MSLFDTWQSLAAASDEVIHIHWDALFASYKTAAGEMLAQDAQAFSRLSDTDERAYERFMHLMDDYQTIIQMIEGVTSLPPAVDELLAGILAILQSRLRHVEENETPSATNPVSNEKHEILGRTLDYINNFPAKIPAETGEFLRGAFLLHGADALHNEMKTNDAVLTAFYAHYNEGLRFCLSQLDDLHARKAAGMYMDWVQREWEVLQDMIRVQAAALEGIYEESPKQKNVVASVLNVLREAYQQTGPLAEALQRLSSSTPARMEEYGTYSTFTQRLNQFATEPQPQIFAASPNATPFYEALAEEIDSLYVQQRIGYLKIANQWPNIVEEEIRLATEVNNIFRTTHQTLINNPIETNEIEMQILQGITETMEIKISSIIDGIEDFNGQTANLMQSFAQEKNDITDEMRQIIYTAIRDAWFAAPPASSDVVPEFFAQCREGAAFAPYRANYEKDVAFYNEKIEKAAIRFKCEVLLYEIATYEEILTHSVSRLRESASEHVQDAAANLEGAYAALEILLGKNDITPIRPAPHDPFNGKEHEVLMAEQQESFIKGEIIKRVGSGYRYKDMVLMRANVIAAR
ncbi:MAG: nucleotide exchange factor GrpE [Defluviitaleaceae bacterium]|nr:nucleotide exchange factor GrpE [Defluviitaleaceae bacterium]